MATSLKKALGWSALGSWATQAINAVITVVLARILGAETYGIVGLIALFLALSQAISFGALSQALIKAPVLDRRLVRTILWAQMAISVLCALVIAGAGPLMADAYQLPILTWLMLTASLIPIIQGVVGIYVDLSRRQMQFEQLAKRSVLGSLAAGVTGLSLAVAGAGPWALVVMQLVQWLVQGLVLARAAGWRLPVEPTATAAPGAVRTSVRFGLSVVLVRILSYLDTQSPRVGFAYLFSLVDIGRYNVSLRFAEVLLLVMLVPIQQVAAPQFVARHAEDRAPAQRALRLLRFATLILFPALWGLAALAPEVVDVLLGPGWHGTATYVQAVTLGMVAAPFSYIMGDYLLMNAGIVRRVGIQLVNIVASAVVIALFTQVDAATAVWLVVAKGLVTIGAVVYMATREAGLKVRDFVTCAAPATIGALIMGLTVVGATYLLAGTIGPLPRLLCGVVIGALTYALVLRLFFRPVVDELLVNLAPILKRLRRGKG